MSSNSAMRVADVVAQQLAPHADWAFGVPGGEVLTLIDALDGSGIRFVCARHETSAGFMAEGAQRMGDALGVLVATVGPGVANTINVVAHAQQARRPLVVLTGCVGDADSNTYTHQVFDHQQVLRPLCLASFRLTKNHVADTMARAITIARQGGAVHIDVPVSVADEPTLAGSVRDTRITHGTATDDATLMAAREALANARRPLVLAGLELLRGDGHSVLRQHFERCGFPVVTTYEAKGIVDEGAAAAIGGAGLSPKADRWILPLVKAADVVLLAGYDPVEMRHPWRHPFDSSACVIEVGRQLGHHGMHQADFHFVGEPQALLENLLTDLTLGPGWPDGEPHACRAALVDAFAPRAEWGPSRLLADVQEVVDDHTVVAVDTGAHRILLCQQWRLSQPNQLIQSNGTSTMACAIPFAIGAKLKRPKSRVLAIVGDGGLEMALGELGTVRDLGLAMTIVVVDDRSLALIEKKQRSRGLKNLGVDFGPGDAFEGTDYVKIAEAFGGRGVRVTNSSQLKETLRQSLTSEGFTLLHCPIDRHAYDGRI